MSYRRLSLLAFIVAAVVCGVIIRAADDNNYQVTILVANEPGEAPVTDAKLVNGWGIAASATSPWWVSDNGSGFATVYTGAGAKAALEVTVPGAPTGIVSYSGTQFELRRGFPARFIFASEDGTLSAWNSGFDATHAHVVFSDFGAIYKGLAVLGNTLYATDFAGCKVVAVNGTFGAFTTAGGFKDAAIPDGYCPFGIQAIGTSIFVTYAKRAGVDDEAGVSHGFVDEFDASGDLLARVAQHGPLNSPWGLALAPADFGAFGGCLLVGNFGDGFINAYCEDRSGFHHRGRLKSKQGGEDVQIDGLWGIGFGNGRNAGPANVLYFAAGPDDEANGYFGKVEVVR